MVTHSQRGGAQQWTSEDGMIDSSLRLALAAFDRIH